jgi:hypothetical protein
MALLARHVAWFALCVGGVVLLEFVVRGMAMVGRGLRQSLRPRHRRTVDAKTGCDVASQPVWILSMVARRTI